MAVYNKRLRKYEACHFIKSIGLELKAFGRTKEEAKNKLKLLKQRAYRNGLVMKTDRDTFARKKLVDFINDQIVLENLEWEKQLEKDRHIKLQEPEVEKESNESKSS